MRPPRDLHVIYEQPDLYDAQHAHYRDDLGFYADLAHDYGSPVLELGAGTGRLSAALARADHTVVAVELSERMLLRARERLEADSLAERVTLVQGDMRELRLERAFPLVVLPFNTLMHAYTLADQDATLATVRRHLAPGGLLALDLYNPNFNELNVLRREAEWGHVGGERGELFLHQTHDPDRQIIETRYYLDTTDTEGCLKRRTAVLTQRYYTRFELERALRQSGFGTVQLFGDFGRGRYSTRAGHLICLARV